MSLATAMPKLKMIRIFYDNTDMQIGPVSVGVEWNASKEQRIDALTQRLVVELLDSYDALYQRKLDARAETWPDIVWGATVRRKWFYFT